MNWAYRRPRDLRLLAHVHYFSPSGIYPPWLGLGYVSIWVKIKKGKLRNDIQKYGLVRISKSMKSTVSKIEDVVDGT